MRFINTFPKSFHIFVRNKKLSFSSIILDFAFLFLFGGFTTIIWTRIMDKTKTMMELMAKTSPSLQEVGTPASLKALLTQSSSMQAEFSGIASNLLLYFFGALILWVLLQGITWWICHKICNNKQPLHQFLKQFLYISLGASIIFLIFLYLSVRISLALILATTPLISQETINTIIRGSVGLVFFLSIIAYSTFNKKWFKKYLQNLKDANTWLAGILISITFFIFYIIIKELMTINYWLFLLFALLIILPSFTFFRIYLIEL